MTNELPQDPERLRRDIAATRADMDRTLAELEDRVSPSRIRERQTEKVRTRWNDVRTAVMGQANEAGERTSGMAHGAQEALQHAPDRVEDAARGNPLAAGLIAFGLGALAGSLFPATGPERRAASQLRDEFEEPARASLQEAADEVRSELQEHAQHAVEDTKQTA
jgi:hypothetical protein